MKRLQCRSIRWLGAAIGCSLVVTGCGGGGSGPGSPSSPAAPAQIGTYQATYNKGDYSKGDGTAIIYYDGNGNLSFAVNDSSTNNIFIGSAVLQANDTYSTTLHSATTSLTTTATGATTAGTINIAVGGAAAVPGVNAVFESKSNVFAGGYIGTANGGSVGNFQALTLAVTGATNGSQNLTGSLVTSLNGTLTLTGTVSPTGSLTATAPFGTLGDSLTFTGQFAVTTTQPTQITGTWTDSMNASNTGTFTATISGSPQARR